MKTLKNIFLNPGFSLSLLTVFVIFVMEDISGEENSFFFSVIAGAISTVIILGFYWFSSVRPINYNTVAECLADITSDILVTVFLFVITAFSAVYSYLFIEYIGYRIYIIFGYLLLITFATFFECYITTKNSLESMYRKNPVNITN